MLSACGTAPPNVRLQPVQAAVNPAPPPAKGAIRATGLLRAVRVFTIQVPQLAGGGGRITLVKLLPNGAAVKQGDTLAEFDSTKQEDDALEAKAKYEDLGHQVKQKAAQNKADAEQRLAIIQQATADRDKALIQLRKGVVLEEIDRMKNRRRPRAPALAWRASKSRTACERTRRRRRCGFSNCSSSGRRSPGNAPKPIATS